MPSRSLLLAVLAALSVVCLGVTLTTSTAYAREPMQANDLTVMTTDQTFLYIVRYGVVHKIDKKTMKVVRTTQL